MGIIAIAAPTRSTSSVAQAGGSGGVGGARWTSLADLPEFKAGHAYSTSGDFALVTNPQVTYDATKEAGKIRLYSQPSDYSTADEGYFELKAPFYMVPVGEVEEVTGEYLTTIDMWYDQSMAEVANGGSLNSYGGGVNWKAFMHRFDETDTPGATGAITWEPWLKAALGTASGLGHQASRAYSNDATGQQLNDGQPFLPRGLDSQVHGTSTALFSDTGTVIPYNQWVRLVVLLNLNRPETDFADWNTQTGLTLASGTYHQVSQWWVIGSSVYCVYWKVPLWNTNNTTVRAEYKSWSIHMDTSSDHEQSTGVVRFTGTDGSTISSGSLIYNTAGTKRYRTSSSTLSSGTAQSGSTATTFVIRNSTTLTDNQARGATLTLTGGTGSGQTGIVASNVGATDVLTMVDAWSVTPDNTTTYTLSSPNRIVAGYVDIPVSSSTGTGSPKTAGYFSNVADNTEFTFLKQGGSTPSGVDDASFAEGAITGGLNVLAADAVFYFKDAAMLKNYTLPATPTDDTLIFEAIP